MIKYTFDIALVSESKLDSSVPDSQFSLPGYRIVTKDRNKNGGGILFYPHQKQTTTKKFRNPYVGENFRWDENSFSGIIQASIL